jgi:hypothetical protein
LLPSIRRAEENALSRAWIKAYTAKKAYHHALKILGIIIAVAVIGYMALGILGIGMIMIDDQVDSYTLGVMTCRMLTYGALAAGAVVVIVKLSRACTRSHSHHW